MPVSWSFLSEHVLVCVCPFWSVAVYVLFSYFGKICLHDDITLCYLKLKQCRVACLHSCVWGLRLLSRDGGVALYSVPGLCSPAIRSALIGPPFLWHSCLLEFWALLFFVALQDDLGSSSVLALKQVISTRVPLLENGIRNHHSFTAFRQLSAEL